MITADIFHVDLYLIKWYLERNEILIFHIYVANVGQKNQSVIFCHARGGKVKTDSRKWKVVKSKETIMEF